MANNQSIYSVIQIHMGNISSLISAMLTRQRGWGVINSETHTKDNEGLAKRDYGSH